MEEFSGTETIAAPIEKVWAYLMDVHNVAACTPGFQSLEELGEEHWKAVVSIGVGPVKAKFTLDVTRPEKHEPDLMVVQAHGKAPGSTAELSGRMNLSARDTRPHRNTCGYALQDREAVEHHPPEVRGNEHIGS